VNSLRRYMLWGSSVGGWLVILCYISALLLDLKPLPGAAVEGEGS
jgi:hypothetical protein